MASKSYEFKQIKYHFSPTARKWEFKTDGYILLQACPGGKEIADKVARQVAGALSRCQNKGIDSLGRANIMKAIQ